MESTEEYLSINEFAKKLRVHPNTIRKQLKKGKIQSLKIGGTYRIPASEINRIAVFDMEQMIEKIIDKRKEEGRI